jgi:branched-subunit amino acid aminotransferase/4-amino-4-deoxychorismate lyase
MTISGVRFDGPRPDPERGVFETLLVTGGRPVGLEPHLARLEASLATLYGIGLPAEAAATVEEAAAGLELGRLRLDATPDGGTAVTTADVDPAILFPSEGLVLTPVAVPGGIGEHKWADRRLIEAAEAQVGTPLLVDADDGAALEGARSNLFTVRDGAVITPPTDGRLLPGTTRAQVIEVVRGLGVELREETVDLTAADEVFLSGAVRGVQAVVRCEGVGEWDSGELTARVGAELRELWLG